MSLNQRKPDWLKVRLPSGERYTQLKHLLRKYNLHSVCEEANCPNIGECFNAGEATFIILGDTCTRSCGFCSIHSGRPGVVDILEPARLAETVARLGLEYVVITSVNRDDLDDGGAEIWAMTIKAIRHRMPHCQIEVLTPDFEGNWDSLQMVVEACPSVYNHNIETVPRLYREVRPKAVYQRSLEMLSKIKAIDREITTKSGIMVGLGETLEEVEQTMTDLHKHNVDLLTVGQYLQPDQKHLPVQRYWAPDEFEAIRQIGARLGFKHVEAGPLVRSSFHAAEMARAAKIGG